MKSKVKSKEKPGKMKVKIKTSGTPAEIKSAIKKIVK